MKKKESFDLNWLKPNKLNILFSILIFLAFIFLMIGTCMTFKSFNVCFNYLFKDYYLVIIGFFLISYSSSAWFLGARTSLITHWKFKNKTYWIIFYVIFIFVLYLTIAYILGFWPFCRLMRISGGFMNTCSGLILPI